MNGEHLKEICTKKYFYISTGKDCGASPSVANSSTVTTNTLYEGTSTYSCDQGYEEIAGNTVLKCDTDGNWIGTTPQCDSKSFMTMDV